MKKPFVMARPEPQASTIGALAAGSASQGEARVAGRASVAEALAVGGTSRGDARMEGCASVGEVQEPASYLVQHRDRRQVSAVSHPVRPLVDLLEQLGRVVSELTPEQYAAAPVGVMESSVGTHVRHCLDHVGALLGAAEFGRLDYDRRKRGTPIETDRTLAVNTIRSASARLARLPAQTFAGPVRVSVMLAPDEPSIEVQSSLGRELAFVVSHTVHHGAIIAATVKLLGGNVPERFGYAPSTLAHLAKVPCAR